MGKLYEVRYTLKAHGQHRRVFRYEYVMLVEAQNARAACQRCREVELERYGLQAISPAATQVTEEPGPYSRLEVPYQVKRPRSPHEV